RPFPTRRSSDLNTTELPAAADDSGDLSSPSADSSGGTATASLTNRRLLSRLTAYVGRIDGQKRLADEAFTSGLAAQKHLLRALFTADAHAVDGTMQLISESVGFLEDVQM